MDLDGWEILSNETPLIDLHEDQGISQKNTSIIDLDYFQKFDEENREIDEKVVVYEEKKVNSDVGNYELDEKLEQDCEFDKKPQESDDKLVVYEDEGENNICIWKWAINGMGALVTFGFAAATVSLIVFSNRHKKENSDRCKKPDLHFQIYSHGKRFKQVVRRAKRLNEAISVMRGAPLTRAQITVGGYYEAL